MTIQGTWRVVCSTNIDKMTVQDEQGRYIIYTFAHSGIEEGSKPIACPTLKEQRVNAIAIAQTPKTIAVMSDVLSKLKESPHNMGYAIQQLEKQLALIFDEQ